MIEIQIFDKLRAGMKYGGVVLILIAGYVIYSPAAQAWVLKWGGILSGLASALFSFLLVILYDQQRRLLAAEQQPIIEVEGEIADEDHFRVFISNAGKGVATNMELVTVCLFTKQGVYQPGVDITSFRRSPKGEDDRRRGNSIKPGEDKIPFDVRPGIGLNRGVKEIERDGTLPISRDDPHKFAFGTGLKRLQEEGVDVVRLHFYVRYEDALETKKLKYFSGIEFSINNEDLAPDDFEFETVYSESGPMIFGDPDVISPDYGFDISTAEMTNQRTIV